MCFPSSWRPEEKIGLPVHAIHTPVPTLNENLGSCIDKFLSNLEPGKAWERSNWGLSCSAELNQHPVRDVPRLIPPISDSEAWIHIEDQVLYRLPQSGALLFGIRLVNVSLAELKQFPRPKLVFTAPSLRCLTKWLSIKILRGHVGICWSCLPLERG